MDWCGGKRSRFHFKACPSQSQAPHSGSSTPIHHYRKLKALQKYLWALPKPVLSNDDITLALIEPPNPPSTIWDTWSKDPTKAAVLQALFSCQVRLGRDPFFCYDMADALTQRRVCLLQWNWRKYITKNFSDPSQNCRSFLITVQIS